MFQAFWEEHKGTFIQTYLFGNLTSSKELQPFLFHLALQGKQRLLSQRAFLKSQLGELSQKECINLLEAMPDFSQLEDLLWGHHYSLPKPKMEQTLGDLATAFYPKNGFGYGKSYAYGYAAPQGSLFKMVTAL